MNTDLVANINQSLEISLPASASPEEFKQHLAAHINHLINHDFEKLIFYLYRIDVHEDKMRTMLENNNGENAATLIANLIIERQLQKIKSRQQFSQRDNDIDDEEKW